jgi:hypothetical protein
LVFPVKSPYLFPNPILKSLILLNKYVSLFIIIEFSFNEISPCNFPLSFSCSKNRLKPAMIRSNNESMASSRDKFSKKLIFRNSLFKLNALGEIKLIDF